MSKTRVTDTNGSFNLPISKYTIKFDPIQTYDGVCQSGWVGYRDDIHEAVEMCHKDSRESNIMGSYTIEAKGDVILDETLVINVPITFVGDNSDFKASSSFVGDTLISTDLDSVTFNNCPPFPDGEWEIDSIMIR